MYSKLLNEKIRYKYEDLESITQNFQEFFEQISFMSPSIESVIMDSKAIKEEEMVNWYNNIQRLYDIQRTKLSFIIICKDEEKTIKRCLCSIMLEKEDGDEILVIDTGSNDDTKNIIANKFEEVRLIEAIWNNDFSEIRNLGITLANNEWIFFIDADEVLVRGTIKNLKKYLKIIEWYKFKEIVISPTIINHNNHIINSVKRILRKSDNIRFYGVVHEEPRKVRGNIPNCIAFENVQLLHDGYKRDVINAKNKVKRNYELLVKMVEKEPFNPRWTYFLCRDCKELLEENVYEKYLLQSVKMCKNDIKFKRYKEGALIQLIQFYLNKNDTEKFQIYLCELEKYNGGSSNVVYFKSLQRYDDYYKKICQLRNEIIEYRNSKSEIEYGGIHSNYYHIELLIGWMLFNTGKYAESLEIFKHLESKEFCNYKQYFNKLYDEISLYLE